MSTYTFKPMPRFNPGWKEQPDLFERYWDEAMKMIEQLQNRVKALEP